MLSDSDLGATLGNAAAVVAIAGAALGLMRGVRQMWFRSVGQRRHQQRQVDRLAIGSSSAYILELLGTPQFVQGIAASPTHYHRLAGAWVSVSYVGGSVGAFAVTVRNRRLWISTEGLTLGQLSIRLGRTWMQDVTSEASAEEAWIGARRSGHLREFYFGAPGGYQTYWLAYNDAGVGTFEPEGSPIDSAAIPRRTTANTLVVAGPAASRLAIIQNRSTGVDLDVVRLAR